MELKEIFKDSVEESSGRMVVSCWSVMAVLDSLILGISLVSNILLTQETKLE